MSVSRRFFALADQVHAAIRLSLVRAGGGGVGGGELRRARAGFGWATRVRTRRTTASPAPPLGRRSVASRKTRLRPCGSRRRAVLVPRSAAPLHPAAVSVAYRRDPVQTCRARARASCS